MDKSDTETSDGERVSCLPRRREHRQGGNQMSDAILILPEPPRRATSIADGMQERRGSLVHGGMPRRRPETHQGEAEGPDGTLRLASTVSRASAVKFGPAAHLPWRTESARCETQERKYSPRCSRRLSMLHPPRERQQPDQFAASFADIPIRAPAHRDDRREDGPADRYDGYASGMALFRKHGEGRGAHHP